MHASQSLPQRFIVAFYCIPPMSKLKPTQTHVLQTLTVTTNIKPSNTLQSRGQTWKTSSSPFLDPITPLRSFFLPNKLYSSASCCSCKRRSCLAPTKATFFLPRPRMAAASLRSSAATSGSFSPSRSTRSATLSLALRLRRLRVISARVGHVGGLKGKEREREREGERE